MKGAATFRKSRAALAAVLLAALFFTAIPGRGIWPERAYLFVTYMKATGRSEEPMTWMERIAVSYLMAGQKVQKAKEAGSKPASLSHSI